jgi:hypothetical protein
LVAAAPQKALALESSGAYLVKRAESFSERLHGEHATTLLLEILNLTLSGLTLREARDIRNFWVPFLT